MTRGRFAAARRLRLVTMNARCQRSATRAASALPRRDAEADAHAQDAPSAAEHAIMVFTALFP